MIEPLFEIGTPGPSRDLGLDYHAARVLLLVNAFSQGKSAGIDGLTKLAKLDFLLRYPVLMATLSEREAYTPVPDDIRATEQEQLAVESRMVRYKYGPWDDRYYPILGILLGTGLLKSSNGKGRLSVSVTRAGRQVASRLAESPTWRIVAARCDYIHENFDATGNRLKEMIYENLPEAVDRPHRTYI